MLYENLGSFLKRILRVNGTVRGDFEYKLIIADKKPLEPVAWEDRENRWITSVPQKDEMVVDGTVQACFNGRNWRGAGTAIPVFSLRDENDFGVGEFYDL